MIGASRLFSCAPRRLLLAVLLLAAAPNADAQAPRTLWVSRDEMIGAIIGFAATECGKLDEFLPELFAAHCKDPTGGSVVYLMARAALASRSDAALRELCRKSMASRNVKRRRNLAGPADLGARHHCCGQPPFRQLEPRQPLSPVPRRRSAPIVDTASGQLVDKALHKWRADAFAWSPDRRLAALSASGEIRVPSVGSWEEVSTKRPTNEGCRTRLQRYMAFAPDSRSLWVLCSNFRSLQARVAQKLSVPELRVEDEVLLSPAPGAARTAFRAVAIARHADDVIVTGTLYQYGEKGELQQGGGTIALSLTRKQPVYPPLAAYPFIKHSGDLSRLLLYKVRTTGATNRRGFPTEWAVETWDTASGKKIGSFGGATDADSTS